jgi:hypothetical protein
MKSFKANNIRLLIWRNTLLRIRFVNMGLKPDNSFIKQYSDNRKHIYLKSEIYLIFAAVCRKNHLTIYNVFSLILHKNWIS